MSLFIIFYSLYQLGIDILSQSLNIYLISVTLDTSQFSRPLPVNLLHFLNNAYIFITLDTSQFDKSQLKFLHQSNIHVISVTLDTSQFSSPLPMKILQP